MPRLIRVTYWLLASAIVLACSITGEAGALRAFVSTTGNDLNTSLDCSPSANCRTFAAALSVTDPGGEIVVLNSGGYGPATISQPVMISAIGVDASISGAPGDAALTINTTGNVTLVGLSLHGAENGAQDGAIGIRILVAGFVRMYDTLIEGFLDTGVQLDFQANGGKLAIYGSKITDNTLNGVSIQG